MRGLLLRFLCLLLSSLSTALVGQSVIIISEMSEGLIGVHVSSQDKSFNGISDIDGIIDIKDWDQRGNLTFSSLGFESVSLNYDQLSQRDFSVELLVQSYDAEEVVIFGRHAYDEDEIPLQIVTIKAKQLESTNPQTAADALSQHGDVYVQKSQMGGGSPVIRGFEANRVLLVIDGVRLNNAIYRNGHLQNAITVDQSVINRMDVIFGPNSLMYGSDALGGVVHFQTKDAPFSTTSETATQVNFYTRYASANQEKSAHIDYAMGSQKLSSLTSLTYVDYGDLRAGDNRRSEFPDFGKRLIYQQVNPDTGLDQAIINDDPNLQVGTAYSQMDLLQKVSWLINDHSDLNINFQYSTSSDVPRYDNLSELQSDSLRYAQWHYGPQNRLLSAMTYKNYKPSKVYDNMNIILSYQNIDEDRITRLWDNPIREIQQEDVNVWAATVDFTKGIGSDNMRIDYGVDIQHNQVRSSARGENIFTGDLMDGVLSRYGSDKNSLTNAGAYFFISNQGDRLNWNTGLRYSRTDYNLSYSNDDPVDWPIELIDGVNGNNDAFTFSASATARVSKDWLISSVVSSAFRSPNIDDLSRIRVNGREISFPNLQLSPETSLNAELGISGEINDILSISNHAFITRLSDAIVRRDFMTPDGSPTYVNRGDTLRVIANQNISEALIIGFSSKLKLSLGENVKIDASVNLINGDEIITGEDNIPFGHIPPTYGQVGLSYDSDKFNISGIFRYNGFKPIEEYGGSVDNPELATPIGALSWSTYNLHGQYHLSQSLSINLGIENLFDLNYRPFASGVSAAGRNVIVALRGRF